MGFGARSATAVALTRPARQWLALGVMAGAALVLTGAALGPALWPQAWLAGAADPCAALMASHGDMACHTDAKAPDIAQVHTAQ